MVSLTAGSAPPRVWPEKTWLAQNGSQVSFTSCDTFECLYHGPRGPGKTTGLILDFLQHVGQGYGPAWRGVVFRRSYPELADLRVKIAEACRKVRKSARWITGENKWLFRDGAELLLRFMARPGDYRLRYLLDGGGFGDFTAEFEHRVIGQSAAPPDVPNLFFENGRLLWDYPNAPPDLAGFRIRSHAGDNRAWASALEVNPAGLVAAPPFDISKFGGGTRTFMVKAVDVAGNESVAPAVVVLGLGDVIRDNVVLTTDYHPAFPGTVTNGTVNAGVLEAAATGDHWLGDDGNVLWRGEDQNPVWDTQFLAMVYEAAYTPRGPARLSLDLTIAALDGWSLEVAEALVGALWEGEDMNPLWSGVDAGAWWAATPGAFFAWPGELQLLRREYRLRLTTFQGTRQARLQALSAVLDVPDVLEDLSDVALGAGGTRLPITKDFTAITGVRLTQQDDGGAAVRLVLKDRDAVLGPLVQGENSAGAGTAANVDAQVQGYNFETM